MHPPSDHSMGEQSIMLLKNSSFINSCKNPSLKYFFSFEAPLYPMQAIVKVLRLVFSFAVSEGLREVPQLS